MIALCRSIFTRHRIPADRVLAHSDVAPSRKKDPGEKFPWRLLHDSGIGLWVKPAPITAAGGRIFVLGDRDPEVKTLQTSLRTPGYGIETSGSYDSETMAVVAAFQRHYRPAKVDGIADVSTVATLGALLSAHEPRSNGSAIRRRIVAADEVCSTAALRRFQSSIRLTVRSELSRGRASNDNALEAAYGPPSTGQRLEFRSRCSDCAGSGRSRSG